MIKYATYNANNSDYDGVNEKAIAYNNLGGCRSSVGLGENSKFYLYMYNML